VKWSDRARDVPAPRGRAMLRRRRLEVKANALILASVQEPHFSRRNCSTGVYTCNRWVTSRMGAFSPVWSRDVLKEFAWAAIQCFRNLHNVFQLIFGSPRKSGGHELHPPGPPVRFLLPTGVPLLSAQQLLRIRLHVVISRMDVLKSTKPLLK
jgi:hypothetical protein